MNTPTLSAASVEATDELVRWIDLAQAARPQADWPQEAAQLLGLAEVLVSESANALRGEAAPALGAAC